MNIQKKAPEPPRGRSGPVLTEDDRIEQQASLALQAHTDTEAREQTDALVQQAQAGDAEAFGRLAETYEKFVYHTALRVLRTYSGRPEDGEDIAQSAFLKAWRSLDSFRGECAFSTWLYRIVVNTARDHCRTEGRRHTVSLTVPDEEDGTPVDIDIPVTEGDDIPEDALNRKETIRCVRRAIQSLPPDMRRVILLRDIQDLSYSDISDLLGIEVGTVKSRINRGRQALREALRDLL